VVTLLYIRARQFYVQHPNHSLHPQWPLSIDWALCVDGIRHLDRHLVDVTPMVFSAMGAFVIYAGLLAAYAIKTRQWLAPALGLLVMAGTLASFLVPKMHDGGYVFTFSYGRMYLALPLATVFVAILCADGLCSHNAQLARGLAMRLTSLLLVGFGFARLFTLNAETRQAFEQKPIVVGFVKTETVLKRCADIDNVARSVGAELVIEAKHSLDAYACSAMTYGRLNTIYPPYDRRTQLLLDERDRIRHTVLVSMVSADQCSAVRRRGIRCTMQDGIADLALVKWSGSALAIAEKFEIPIRPL
jgi:hypothetical protein